MKKIATSSQHRYEEKLIARMFAVRESTLNYRAEPVARPLMTSMEEFAGVNAEALRQIGGR